MQASEILIGLGANLPNEKFGTPMQTLTAAIAALRLAGLKLVAQSSWWESAPVPISDQPWFVNGVIVATGDLDPVAMLKLLLETERAFGRRRSVANAPRTLDLDLLAHGAAVRAGPEDPILPHPRLAERAFVLLPLAEIRPDWRHPVSGLSVAQLIAKLPPGQEIRRRPD